MDRLKKIFPAQKPFVIGMVHCAPLSGYPNSPGEKMVRRNFIADLRSLLSGRIDAVMIENNYDIPHLEKAKVSTIPQLTALCLEARKLTKKPLGLCVLWNDYEAALSIAKVAGLNFVRIPVFVDRVKTDYGIFSGKAKEVIEFRKKIGAENILILADVQVKHAKHLIKRRLKEAVREAVAQKADAVIVTGKWTGDPPTVEDVAEAKKAAGKTPVILGSGITPENVKGYEADGLIIGSHFKGEGSPKEKDYHNIFPWKSRIQKRRVSNFMEVLDRR